MRYRLLIVSIGLCLYALVGCTGTESADDGVDTEAANEAVATIEPTTESVSESEAVEESGEMTETTEMTSGEEMTDTEEMLEAQAMTNTMQVASAELQNTAGNVVGTAIFSQTEEGPVLIHVTLSEFAEAAEGEHGIHIHETGECTPDFEAAGSHYNPTDNQHGLENPEGAHGGDLPNITVDADGNASYAAETDRITLTLGDTTLFDDDGSTLMLHASADDQVTDPSGNSGDRIACGVIKANADVSQQ